MTRNKLFICIVIFCAVLYAQNSSDRAIIFPDLDNHFTLVSDFHSHTAFSDGDMSGELLTKVRRTNKQVIESEGSGVVMAKAN